MRFALSLLVAALALSACGGPRLTPEQRAQKKANIAQTNAAVETAKVVNVRGKSFRVAHVVERKQSLVFLLGAQTAYTSADVLAASRAATGCAGTFDAGILEFLTGDIKTANLAEISSKLSSDFKGWSVRLSC